MPLNLALWAFRCQGMSVHHCRFPPRWNSHYLPTLSSCIFHPATSSSINQTTLHWVIIPLCFIRCKERNHLTERVLTWMTSLPWQLPTERFRLQHSAAAEREVNFLHPFHFEFASSYRTKCWHFHLRSVDSGRPLRCKVRRESNQALYTLWQKETSLLTTSSLLLTGIPSHTLFVQHNKLKPS